jgi:hypothetical protein
VVGDLGRARDADLLRDRADLLVRELLDCSDDSHTSVTPPAGGPEGVKATVAVYQDALDGHWDVQEMHSAGDRVFTRWIGRGTHIGELDGIAPTGATIAVEALTMNRIAGGRIAEDWTVWDALGLLQQIGAVPAAA